MKAEIQRRAGKTAAVIALFRSTPQVWVSWQALAEVGGMLAWRTRVSDARKVFQREGGALTWNGEVEASAYMYRPQAPLGRPAHQYQDASLF